MEAVRTILEQVWKELQRAGASDDLETVEYIAALLLEDRQLPASASDEMPHKPPIRYGILEDEQRRSLEEAATSVGGKAALFDPHVLFHTARIGGKDSGTFPVPRHIVTFILRLLAIGPEHSLADFACGSGGFLVYRTHPDVTDQQPARTLKQVGQNIGVELSPRWARIARGNAALHTLTYPTTKVYTGDAFLVCAPGDVLAERKFDRIAIAPPFGARIDPQLARSALSRSLPEAMRYRNTGFTSEVLFPLLALDRLQPGGRGIVLAPSSLLYREKDSAALLRQQLVEARTLRGVVLLAAGMLSPFVDQEVYLLLLEKDPREQTDWPWFFKVERDGYSSEGRRDLASGPDQPEASDIPFAQAVLQLDNTALQDEHTQHYPELSFRFVGNASRPLGTLIQVHEGATLDSIRLFQVVEGPRQGSYLLVKATLAGEQTSCWELTLAQDGTGSLALTSIASEREWLRQLYPQRSIAMAGMRVIEGGIAGQRFAIASDGRLLGATQAWENIAAEDYNLQPEAYVPSHAGLPPEPAARLLTSVRRDQRAITRIVDTLLGNLEIQPRIGRQLPPPPHAFDDLSLMQLLGPEQQAIYQQIQDLARQAGGYAPYFTPEQLAQRPGASDIITIRQTLDLLEHIGLIVQVMVKAAGSETARPYYRPVTELDITTIKQ